jgi:RNA polymerase sigma factor for flagellar operon FliA
MSASTYPSPELHTVAATPAPTAQTLWQRYHQRAEVSAENDLVEQYLPLVACIMGRLAMTLPEHVSHDDLYSAGLVGLLQALRNYDPTCGSSFETYARVRIRGAMLDELRHMDWVPRSVHEKARKIQNTMAGLEQKLGCAATEAQMARALGVSVPQYNELLDQIRPATFVCLNSATYSEDGETDSLYEAVEDMSEQTPLEHVSQRELKRVILERIKELPEIQRKVLALYYGEDLHLREIAEAFGLTESRICQIHAQAILSIRAYVQRFESGLVGQPANAFGS